MVFYRSFYDALRCLSDEELASAFRVLAEYGLNGVELECTGTAKVVLMMAKPQIDKNNLRYENGKKGAEFGKLGGRPKKPQENPKETPKKPQENPNQTPNVNVNDNVNVIKKKDTSVSKEKVHFVPPTLENVIGYCREKGYKNFDAQRFVDFYECKGWMVGKNKMKDWKAAVRNWARGENAPVKNQVQTKFHNFEQHAYDKGELDKFFVN
jgi:hypothetical protein